MNLELFWVKLMVGNFIIKILFRERSVSSFLDNLVWENLGIDGIDMVWFLRKLRWKRGNV